MQLPAFRLAASCEPAAKDLSAKVESVKEQAAAKAATFKGSAESSTD
ncbi:MULTISPECIES: hypothetical protein [unclassified Streptomyces]|nr:MULTISPECIES: hypothetical protein [unclassified Streptomyces]MCM1970554.1 hypothetical protein [Streptomyces sp. G1]MCX5130362.1 hypothetical protein [Streptomyces sp. NBC_00347]MCX5301743.1 hypothetical protein [Streptomyces sp. NBC_00193]